MKRTCSYIIIFILSQLLLLANPDSVTFNLSEEGNHFLLRGWKYSIGDDANWRNPGVNDTAWQSESREMENHPGVRWYRKKIELTGEMDEYDVLALYVAILPSAYELYWDGVKVGENGIVAKLEGKEKPGDIIRTFKLKRAWTTPGEHLLAIRLSNYSLDEIQPFAAVRFGYHAGILQRFNELSYYPIFDLGIFLLGGFFSFALFFGGGRRRPYLVFSLYCFSCALGLAANIYPLFHTDTTVEYVFYLRQLQFVLIPLTAVLLTIYFILNFELPHKYRHIITAIVLGIAPLVFFGIREQWFVLLYAAGMAIYAIHLKKAGSIIALVGVLGLLAMLAIMTWSFHPYAYPAGITFFIFCVTLSTSQQLKKTDQMLEAARLRSARLEAELLKKNIQPHFLMNTLLSIMSWIREDPAKAVELIKALAEEFRLVNKISAEKEISLQEEITLCRNHLRLMGFRKDAQYELIEENLPENEKIPPMVIHTLVENGLTHAFRSGENGYFRLSCEQNNGTLHYRLRNNGSLLGKKNGQQNDKPSAGSGMGLRYVKARLEERYPQKWKLDYGMQEGNWEVNIYIDKQ